MRFDMRRFLLVAGAAAFSSSVVMAAQTCIQNEDRDAFLVVGLRTYALVVALQCWEQVNYNAFVVGRDAPLRAAEARLRLHLGGARQYEIYLTYLANFQAQQFTRRGSDACPGGAANLVELVSISEDANLMAAAERIHATTPLYEGIAPVCAPVPGPPRGAAAADSAARPGHSLSADPW